MTTIADILALAPPNASTRVFCDLDHPEGYCADIAIGAKTVRVATAHDGWHWTLWAGHPGSMVGPLIEIDSGCLAAANDAMQVFERAQAA